LQGRVAEIGSPRSLVEAGMRKEEQENQRAHDAEDETIPSDEDANVEAAGESGSSTEVDVEAERDGDEEVNGTGAFWELVKKSAEREKLVDMIFGSAEAE
jgi:hypothetical protein